MPPTVLITGFGRFPGAPFNPSGPLAQALARRRRPALADARRVAHVFATSYAAVDRDLPVLLARHAPDIVLMLGLASRARYLRIEMHARNAIAPLVPDVVGAIPVRRAIADGAPARLATRAPSRRLAAAARSALAAQVSRDAGRYLCNYAYWQALASAPPGCRTLVQFVHVPQVRRNPHPRGRLKRRPPTVAELAKAVEAILVALVAARRS